MKVIVVTVIIGAPGTNPKNLRKRLRELQITRRITATIQARTLRKTARILRRVPSVVWIITVV